MSDYKAPANIDEVSVDEFYEMIEETLNDSPEDRQWPYYAMDYVASRQEWENFKTAMTRWMETKDRETIQGFDSGEAEEREDALRVIDGGK